jgi:dipeptidyl aminopeptidase/acylaminoacyl peptidase
VDIVDALFRGPADASAEPVRLNDPLALGPVVGDVARFTLDARGRIVLFEANLDDIDRRELVSVSLQSLGPARRVNASNAGSQGVRGHRLTTDGERVVYRADQDAPLRFELFSAPADASATPLRLNPPLAADRQVLEDFQLGAGDRVLYRADQELDELYELYAVPVTGGSALKLSDPILGNVQSFLVSGGRAIHQTSLGLYSVPIDGSLPPLRLDDPLVSAGTLFDYQSSEDDAWIVYRLQPTSPSRPWKIFSVPAAGGPVNPLQTQEVHSVIQYSFSPDGSAVAFLGLSANVQQLYSVPVTGGVPLLLNGPLIAGGGVREFRWTPDGAHLLYRADQEVAGRNELYAVPADASSQPYKLNQTLVAGGQVLSFELSPDGARAVYRADASVDNRIELFSVPIDASQAPVRLNGPMGPNGDVFAVQVLPDSATVLYVSDEVFNVKNELWRMPIDGSTAPVRVSGALLQGSQVRSFRSAAGLVVYLADQDELDVVEIYLSYLTPPRRRR